MLFLDSFHTSTSLFPAFRSSSRFCVVQRNRAMILVTTPTGNIGRSVVNNLMKAGKKLRLYVRDSKKLSENIRKNTDVVEGDLRDTDDLHRAATGIRTAFFCVPQSGESEDVLAYYKSFGEPATAAFKSAAVVRIVTISGGRGNTTDLGPSGPLAVMENAINSSGASTRHIRCGYFMENFLYTIPQIKYRSSFSLPIAQNQRLALMSAQDIGQTATSLLLNDDWTGQKGVSVPFGQSLTGDEIAAILTIALEKPIKFAPITGEEYKQMLMKFGVSQAMAQSLKEMFDTIGEGSIGDSTGTAHNGGLSFSDWILKTLKPAIASGRVY